MASGAAAKGVGIPIKLLHEGEGNVVTVELKNGEVYRGTLDESEESMNCQMSAVTMTGRDGRVSKLEQVYLRGSMIRFVILPDMLKNAPMVKRLLEEQQGADLSDWGFPGTRYPPLSQLAATGRPAARPATGRSRE